MMRRCQEAVKVTIPFTNLDVESLLPYELTPEQVREGWTVEAWDKVSVIAYRNPNGKLHDPAPGVPAYNAWWTNGAKGHEGYYQDNELTAEILWWENGAKRYEGYYQNDIALSETSWLEDGRQEDLIP